MNNLKNDLKFQLFFFYNLFDFTKKNLFKAGKISRRHAGMALKR